MSFTLWFMGRPAAGKSTLASRVETTLREEGLDIENLDGDEIRQTLHPDLGFTREDRAINNRRTAFICKLLNRNGIPVVNAMITPFRESQQEARNIIEPAGRFVLIYVKCSVDEAARRDPKNLYEQAREGKIENFTGVNHPFQEPHKAEVVVDTETQSIDEATDHIINRIRELGVLDEQATGEYGLDISHAEESAIIDRLEKRGCFDED